MICWLTGSICRWRSRYKYQIKVIHDVIPHHWSDYSASQKVNWITCCCWLRGQFWELPEHWGIFKLLSGRMDKCVLDGLSTWRANPGWTVVAKERDAAHWEGALFFQGYPVCSLLPFLMLLKRASLGTLRVSNQRYWLWMKNRNEGVWVWMCVRETDSQPSTTFQNDQTANSQNPGKAFFVQVPPFWITKMLLYPYAIMKPFSPTSTSTDTQDLWFELLAAP